jgi:hypothetical protein
VPGSAALAFVLAYLLLALLAPTRARFTPVFTAVLAQFGVFYDARLSPLNFDSARLNESLTALQSDRCLVITNVIPQISALSRRKRGFKSRRGGHWPEQRGRFHYSMEDGKLVVEWRIEPEEQGDGAGTQTQE